MVFLMHVPRGTANRKRAGAISLITVHNYAINGIFLPVAPTNTLIRLSRKQDRVREPPIKRKPAQGTGVYLFQRFISSANKR